MSATRDKGRQWRAPRASDVAWIAAAIAACVMLAGLPAAALDGDTLIDQAKVSAGGITPGDTPGFPATLSLRGRYKLTGNLAAPAGRNGIDVTQHNVAIDLNGFTISSADPASQPLDGIAADGMTGLRVSNGTITGFGSGIDNYDGAFGLVENMRIVSSVVTAIWGGSDSRLRNNTLVNNDIAVFGCSRCLIEQNIVSGGTSGGIQADGAVVVGNVIVSNQNYGLAAPPPGPSTGFGSNILFGNNNGGAQTAGPAFSLHPNLCHPACP